MVVSLFRRSRSLFRGSLRGPASRRTRRGGDRLRLAIDQLEGRRALAITGPLTIGVPGVPDVTVGSYFDAPTGVASVGDFVTVSIEGTKGTVIFNGGKGVADGTDIQTVEILDASPDFQLTFNAAVTLANPVPYASDGVVQMGAITTANVIRGINTVRGPLTNVAVTTTPPTGFNQTAAGNTLTIEGNQVAAWPVDSFIAATPLAPSSPVGPPAFGTITAVSFDSGTNLTTITFNGVTPAGTTAGGLTLAATIQPAFELTSFVGVNFSNLNLKEGGGLFVDRVVGADTVVAGMTIPDLGILLSQGLLAYSTIGIRAELDAAVVLGPQASASVDGRMFIASATNESVIFVGPQTTPTARNSKLQITGGAGNFGAGVLVSQPFNGVVNLGGDATGSWVFSRGVGANAVLNAASWAGQTTGGPFSGSPGIAVAGDFAGTLGSTSGDVVLSIARSMTGTARVNTAGDLSLAVAGSILKGAIVNSAEDISLGVGGSLSARMRASEYLTGAIAGNVSGATLVGSSDISLAIGGSLLNSTITADNDLELLVARDMVGTTLLASESALSVAVGGNVSKSSLTASNSGLELDVGGSLMASQVRGASNVDVSVARNVVNSRFSAGYDYDLALVVGGSLTGSEAQGGADVSVAVAGSVMNSRIASTTGDVTVDVAGDIRNATLVSADDGVTLTAGRDALSVRVVSDDRDTSVTVGRNFSGAVQSGAGDLDVTIAGSVLKGSGFATGGSAVLTVAGNFDGTTTSDALRFFVAGNVSQASRIVAQRVTDWQDAGTPNFGIGGRFDGLVNVVAFDAAANYQDVTLIGGGAGRSARFYVERFATDNLFFGGNFLGNLRVNQDLVANLTFGGNVDRITIGGRVGSYEAGNSIVPTPVAITVAGRLLYMNTNSLFQAAVPGRNGTFYNDATSTTGYPSLAATGVLTTGSYVTVVPNRQVVPTPAPQPPQTYTAPTAPQGFSAASRNGPAGILVTFQAPTSDGGLPVVYYEYSTNATDGSPTWRRFDNPAQGPGTAIVLTVDSAGAGFTPGASYQVAVRAVNAVGATATAPSLVTVVVPPSAPATFAAAVVGGGIEVDFTAPSSTGGGTITYQYTTDNGANWRSFTNPSQGPGTGIALPGPSAGGSGFVAGSYQVSVRATNSAGSTAYTPATGLTIT